MVSSGRCRISSPIPSGCTLCPGWTTFTYSKYRCWVTAAVCHLRWNSTPLTTWWVGLLGHKATDYVRVAPDNNRPVPWPWEPERSTPTSARSSVRGFCLDSQGRAGRSRIGANTRLASPYHSRVTAPESMFFGMADARLAHIISIPILHTSLAAIQNTLVALQRPTSYGTIAAGLPAG